MASRMLNVNSKANSPDQLRLIPNLENRTLCIVFANFGPYHIARVQSAQKVCQSAGINVVGVELAGSIIEYAWQPNRDNLDFELVTICPNYIYEKLPHAILISRLVKNFRDINPDFLALCGYSEIGMIAALVWAKIFGKKVILLSESKEDDASRSRYKELLKKLIVSFYDAAIVGGQPHQRYLEKLGMPKNSIFFGYDVVNNDDFAPDQICHLPAPIKSPFFLAINRFIPKKNLIFLLSAYAQYLQQVDLTLAWHLVLCGDGEMRSQIEQKIQELEIQDWVHLTGFLQQPELLPYFAHAKCFVHASTTEQWGLVVNEAMAAGLPVLVSNRCGCYEDLVVEGVNGYGFDPYQVSSLVERMIVLTKESNLEKLGFASIQHINTSFSTQKFGESVLGSIKYCFKINTDYL